MSILGHHATAATTEQLATALARMKHAHLDEGPASLELRRDRLDRAIALLLDNREAIVAAVSADFGNRSREQTLLSDIAGSVASLKHCREHLAEWMQSETHPAPFPGCEARVDYQPLGVVGVISPWNFPIVLAFGPLASILAAGNRAMLKPSELTPRTSALLDELIARYFDERELCTVLGDAEVGALFSAQPFDHLIFTGGTSVARHIMRAASDNLVPVTLELGGKSPVLVSRSADLATVVQRIMTVKTFNAGQICLAPDYVLLPEELLEDFVGEAIHFVSAMYPTLRSNADYTSIINPRNFDRLRGYLADAEAKGARLVEINPRKKTWATARSARSPRPWCSIPVSRCRYCARKSSARCCRSRPIATSPRPSILSTRSHGRWRPIISARMRMSAIRCWSARRQAAW